MRAEVEAALKGDAQRLSESAKAEQQLRVQQTDLDAMIASEQGRWQDFNARLDVLESSLAPEAPR
jgi:hypothetical protein